MDANKEEVIQCADDLTTLIANQEKSGKNMYDYLRTDFLKDIGGKVQVKGTIVLVIMGVAYTEYLFYYGSLSAQENVQKMAFYAATTAGSIVLKNINSDTNWMGFSYTLLSNSSTVIKELKITIDGIRNVMKYLNAPDIDYLNFKDATGLQRINDDFSNIAMTLDLLGGVKNG